VWCNAFFLVCHTDFDPILCEEPASDNSTVVRNGDGVAGHHRAIENFPCDKDVSIALDIIAFNPDGAFTTDIADTVIDVSGNPDDVEGFDQIIGTAQISVSGCAQFSAAGVYFVPARQQCGLFGRELA
jgi:hypothetical protein